MRDDDTQSHSPLDWLGVVTLVIEAAVLFASRVYSDQFTETFSEFGAELPTLTIVILTPAYGAVCGALLLLIASTQWWPTLRNRPSARRTAMVVGFVAGLVAIMAYVIGLYLPIFRVADQVSG